MKQDIEAHKSEVQLYYIGSYKIGEIKADSKAFEEGPRQDISTEQRQLMETRRQELSRIIAQRRHQVHIQFHLLFANYIV